jgi:hypothetical protein
VRLSIGALVLLLSWGFQTRACHRTHFFWGIELNEERLQTGRAISYGLKVLSLFQMSPAMNALRGRFHVQDSLVNYFLFISPWLALAVLSAYADLFYLNPGVPPVDLFRQLLGDMYGWLYAIESAVAIYLT